MLLLVPSHKADEEGAGKDAAPSSRVLVLLSSNTDISSNVVVPDTAITTTLGTNDTLETIAGNFPQSPFFNPAAAYFTQPKHARDHLGILQPSRPNDPFGDSQQPAQQSNTNRSQDHMDDSRSRRQPSQLDHHTLHSYGGNDTNYNRARRHSHTGLVEFDHSVGPAISGPRSRARQSFSLATPYQHHPLRTPRLLRGAFRKARKDQSPLLTSASFGTDYVMQNPAEEWEGDDIFLPWKTVSSIAEHPSYPTTSLVSTSPKSSLHGVGSLSHLANPREEQLEDIINSKNYTDLDSIDSGDDIELDGDDSNNSTDMAANTTKTLTSPPVPPKREHRDSSEIVDVDGLSDEEMAEDEPSKVATTTDESPISKRARVDQWLKDGIDKKTKEDRTDLEIDLENSLDADMNMILGMASDMELVMPKFDDNYLQDLSPEPALTAFMRGRSSSISNAVSPSCSHSSSTTITCISSHSSPSPSIANGFSKPTTIAHGRSSPLQSNLAGQRTTGQPSAGQDLSSFHRDIDILRRHREWLKEGPELPTERANPRPPSLSSSSSTGSNPSTLSSSASPPLTTDKPGKPASQGPIYFKPSHYNLPDRSGPGEQHLHQNVMIIQSNHWAMDNNKANTGARVFPPRSVGIRGNEGNHIYMVRECSPTPPPPPLLDKSAIMTTHNISLATANMNVLTPQEVQDDYYTRRNMRLSQQRQRRRSSAAVAAAAAAAVTSAATATTGGTSTSYRFEGVSPLASTSSSSSSSSRSASMHGSDMASLLDSSNAFNNNNNKSIVPASIGATMLPTSYYIPPSAFRTEAAVAAERQREMERKRKEDEEEALKDSFLVFPSPTLF